MRKRIFKLVLAVFLYGTISAGCGGAAVNTAPVSNANKVAEEASATAEGSNDRNTNGSALTENSKSEADKRAATTTATPDAEQRRKTIDRYIAGVAKVSDGEEYGEARKIFDGDLDNDGDEDAAVQFTVEGMGGGNNYVFYLAVFINENGNLTAVTDEVIGGKLRRDITFTKIENGRMYFDTKDYAADDGACCPSINGKTAYVLAGNKLKEIKTGNKK